jgi:DNA-binding NarL/FixJ family response regulator
VGGRARGVSGSYAERGPLPPSLVAVLEAAAAGETALETARRLHVSEATVRLQRRTLLVRLGARNTANAVAIGYRFGHIQ